ncbi:M23 family metallopeptidase [Lysinimonas soli]|uniref:M23 family metallopeptidase n=1 Tax=Lysinimonas soli TaxID=1074233 RepID=A0ABW0NXI9_9MICO
MSRARVVLMVAGSLLAVGLGGGAGSAGAGAASAAPGAVAASAVACDRASATAAASAGPSAGPPAGPPWQWPVAAPHPIARPYLAPPTPYAAGHRGIDIRAPTGSPVLAPADGVVHFAGVVVDRPVLSIEHAGGVLSSFEPVQSSLVAGETVTRGQVVGVLLEGHCASACLHLGARVGGEYVNPLLFLDGVPWSVLLPMG